MRGVVDRKAGGLADARHIHYQFGYTCSTGCLKGKILNIIIYKASDVCKFIFRTAKFHLH